MMGLRKNDLAVEGSLYYILLGLVPYTALTTLFEGIRALLYTMLQLPPTNILTNARRSFVHLLLVFRLSQVVNNDDTLSILS